MGNMKEQIRKVVGFFAEKGIAAMAGILPLNTEKVAKAAEVPLAAVKALQEHIAAKPTFAAKSPDEVLGHAQAAKILATIAARIPAALAPKPAEPVVVAQAPKPVAPAVVTAPAPKAENSKANTKKIERLVKLSIRRWLAANSDSSIRANDFTTKAAMEAVAETKATTPEKIYEVVAAELESKDSYRAAMDEVRMILEDRGWEISPRPKDGTADNPTDTKNMIVGNRDFIALLHSVQYDEATAEEAADFFGFVAARKVSPEKKVATPTAKVISLDDLKDEESGPEEGLGGLI